MLGKKIRMSSFLDNNKTFLLALDTLIPHGINENFKTKNINNFLEKLEEDTLDGIVVHTGFMKNLPEHLQKKWPWIAKLTTNSKSSDDKRALIDSVQRTISAGAVAVALNIFVGSKNEKEQFEWMKEISQQCENYGMPLIVFASPSPDSFKTEDIAYTARVASELGADIVKTNYPGNEGKFSLILDYCPVPVIIEKSPLSNNKSGTLETVKGSLAAGGSGILFGERIFNASNPIERVKQIKSIIEDVK